MSDNWQSAFESLEDYIISNPSIKIEPRVLAIPKEKREVFYQHFDRVRTAFIKDYFSSQLKKAHELSANFREIAEDVSQSLKFNEEVELEPKLKRLIDNPMDGMIRALYDPLVDLLKGRIDQEEFMAKGLNLVEHHYKNLYLEGVDLWVMLALVRWLEPAELLYVSQKKPNSINSLTELYQAGQRVEPVPDTSRATRLSFYPWTWHTFIVPDLIVFSNKLNKYVALRKSLPVNTHEPFLVAKKINQKREWYPFNEMEKHFKLVNPWPNILVYTDDDPENIRLIADCRVMLRPELIIDTAPEENWLNENSIYNVKSHDEHLKPEHGTVVLFWHEVPDEAYKAFEPETPAAEEKQEQENVVAPANNAAGQTAQTETGEQAASVKAGVETIEESKEGDAAQPAEQSTPAAKPSIKLLNAGFNRDLAGSILEVFCR